MTSSNIIKIPNFLKRNEPMETNNKTIKHSLIVTLVLLSAIALIGNIEIEPPGKAAETIQYLDEISRKQLDYFLEIAGYVDTINRINFFKPYNQELKEKISYLLKKTAEIEPDECHKQYLMSLSYQVLNDTFHCFTPEWYSLEKNKTEIIFLANETHMQQESWVKSFLFFSTLDWEYLDFKGQAPLDISAPPEHMPSPVPDAAPSVPHKIFDTFIFLNDAEETQRFEEYIRQFDKMQARLPYKTTEKTVSYTPYVPPIKIAHLVYSSMPHQVSIVYPDRELFSQQGRFKIIIFKNLIDAYVECILKPISGKILADHLLRSVDIDTESYLSNLVMYKIAHHMGPVFVIQAKAKEIDKREEKKSKQTKNTDEKGFEIREKPSRTPIEYQGKKEMELQLISETLGDLFLLSEGLKASVIAIHNTSVLIEAGLVPRENEINIYTAYLVSMVDKLRKGPRDPISQANTIQLNYLLKKGALGFNINSQKLSIYLPVFPRVVEELAEEVMNRYKTPYILIREYGQLSPELETILKNLEEIPVDVNINVNADIGFQSQVKGN
ncbi:MAG: hypothetical protein JSV88_29510 [Candidatus Aminicenantes bacterium]|nr:MAG: hypothetical protein JSV88_29510 [Candidatus Aminicenantes bacterium]